EGDEVLEVVLDPPVTGGAGCARGAARVHQQARLLVGRQAAAGDPHAQGVDELAPRARDRGQQRGGRDEPQLRRVPAGGEVHV
ncbi:hypothetical protein DKP78_23045, partial [Enterococcus faecium]